MKKTHRGVEFDVHRLDDTNRWEWIAYPKIGEGDRFAGVVEGDEETATAAAIGAIDAWHSSMSQLRESQVPRGNSPATVDTPAGAFAGTAPLEARLSAALAGSASMAVNADVFRGERRAIAQDRAPFRDDAERAEKLAGALATTIREEIERLGDQRRNEPEWREQIDFLHAVADALDNIVAAISEARRAATPEERDQKFSEAERWATSLAKAAKDFAERNYERVIDYGGYCAMTVLGTLLFTTMFGVPPEFALTSTMVLLGFSGKKKE